MKKALVSPNESAWYISSWEEKPAPQYWQPIFSPVGQRIAEVADQEFEVAPPLFWIDCADDITAESYYYDPSDETIKKIVNTELNLTL